KRFLLVIFSVIIIQAVNAQVYDHNKELELDFTIGASLDLIAGNNPNLERLEVFLKLYPREDFRQEILDFKINANPEAETEYKDVVYYKWNKVNSKYDYGIQSKIKVKNVFNRVRSKINFPFEKEQGLDEFLIETEFIDINEEVKDKTQEIITGETDYYQAVFKIGEWIRQNIEYDLSTLTADTVQKSSWVFDNKRGVCDELTNLFISMLRSVNIPARFVTGTVHTTAIGGFGNHGWAEVYFPGIGWLPFDVTFGQYGWVDASHLKLAETSDSGESSVDYRWLSSGLDVKPRELKLDTDIVKEGSLYEGLVKLSLFSFSDEYRFGSYLPIQVNVQNLQDHYLTTRVYVTKGPSQLQDNSRIVLLKPKEAKTVFWLIRIPSDLDQDLVYSSTVEVKESFGDRDVAVVTYSKDGDYNSLEDLANIVSEVDGTDGKELFSEIYIDCEDDNENYKTGDFIEVKCSMKNSGTIKLEGIRVCFNNDCSLENFGINEEKEFVKKVGAIDNVIVTAENEDLIRKQVLKYNYIKIPRLLITEIRPERVGYNIETEVTFSLSSSVKAKDIKIDIKGFKLLYIDELDGEKEISLFINSKNLRKGLRMDISYQDESGNEYSYEWNYPFVVDNVPWYIRLLEKVGF
ncbi:MAG: transglutaminase domain-containing protein, partial [Nanoarchaeota archaeon]